VRTRTGKSETTVQADVLAGLTAAAVVIPKAMAYATIVR
jgi:MFS superfamily sulfate permease-like transporter